MSVVVGLRKPDYCETKAIELINEAQALMEHKTITDDLNILQAEYDEKIAQAISLLALARVQRNGTA